MSQAAVEGEIIDLPAVRQQNQVTTYTGEMPVSVDEMVAALERKREYMNRVLARVKDGLYSLPGQPDKKILGKPGAENLLSAHRLHPELFDSVPPTIDLVGNGEGKGEPLILFRRGCRIWFQTGPGENDRVLVASAEGLCSSREAKYRYRKLKRKCPNCGVEAINRSKYPPRRDPDAPRDQPDEEPGWYCYNKQGGCGANFDAYDLAIVSQKEGEILNPEIADSMNTILKMADKRAMVAASILATGYSDLLTQDMDEDDRAQPYDGEEQQQASKPRQQQQKPQDKATDDQVILMHKLAEEAFVTLPGNVDQISKAAASAKIEQLQPLAKPLNDQRERITALLKADKVSGKVIAKVYCEICQRRNVKRLYPKQMDWLEQFLDDRSKRDNPMVEDGEGLRAILVDPLAEKAEEPAQLAPPDEDVF